MKKYYPYAIVVVGIMLAAGATFGFKNIAKNNSQAKPVQKQESPKGRLEVSSPCEGVSLPVCGEDHKTYASECLAKFLGVKIASQGMCPKQIIQ